MYFVELKLSKRMSDVKDWKPYILVRDIVVFSTLQHPSEHRTYSH